MKNIILIITLASLSSCFTLNKLDLKELDTQGHRGCRGLYPENTIEAFKHALELGVRTLELDVVVSKDKIVVVSHEPFFNHDIASTPDGKRVEKNKELSYNMYEMTFAEIQNFDVGLQVHPKYQEQKKIATTKPSLEQMIAISEDYAQSLGRSAPYYNIEIKRTPKGDGIYHPEVEEFTDLTLQIIQDFGVEDRTSIQCFSIPVLQYLKEAYPTQKNVFLVANSKSIEKNIKELGFIPDIYSPSYNLINKNVLNFCKQNGVDLIPWTVNKPADMKRLINMGVDGIITDYPNLLLDLINEKS